MLTSKCNNCYKHILKWHNWPQMIAIRTKFVTPFEEKHKTMMSDDHWNKIVRPNEPRVGFDPLYRYDQKVVTEHKIDDEKNTRKAAISKAMSSYLKKTKEYEDFMSKEEQEFDSGRRHLANMMGVDQQSMTQQDIDLAIQYLMPSGLFNPMARPVMRPPREVYPKKKEAMFDEEGRPFQLQFYTGLPNYYQTLHEIAHWLNELDKFEDRLIRKGIVVAPDDAKLNPMGSQWLTNIEMKQLFLEYVKESQYKALIDAFERLLEHPYSKRAEEFIMKYRKKIIAVSSQIDVPPLLYDENGRSYVEAIGHKKYCYAFVTVRGNGTGKVDINGKDLLYFEKIQDREAVMTPLKFCNMLGKVDIECKTLHEEKCKYYNETFVSHAQQHPSRWRGLGSTNESNSIRYAISFALRSFVDQLTIEKMRLTGLLTEDFRCKERKKVNKDGARRAYTWKKR